MDDKHTGWTQGSFIDGPRYSCMSSEWKTEKRSEEVLLVRPSPTGNAICRTNDPDAAAWIAQRLNIAAKLEEIMLALSNDAAVPAWIQKRAITAIAYIK